MTTVLVSAGRPALLARYWGPIPGLLHV